MITENMNYKVYLAGPIASVDLTGATGWRNEATTMLKSLSGGCIQAYSPLRGKTQYLPQTGKIGSTVIDYVEHPLTLDQGITGRDRYDVESSDIMIAHLLGATEKLMGTAVEFGWADIFRIPIIMIIEPEGSLVDHPILRDIASFRVESVDEACYLAKTILFP